eukprot:scaffold9921_cov112-Isochrysis_galbana.AAC.12
MRSGSSARVTVMGAMSEGAALRTVKSESNAGGADIVPSRRFQLTTSTANVDGARGCSAAANAAAPS